MSTIRVIEQTTPATPPLGTSLIYVDSADNILSTIDDMGLVHKASGDVNGPASSANNDFVQFNGTTGKLIKDGGYSPSSFISSALTNTHIFVGNVSNLATDVALSGDATLANTGALTVAKIQGTTVSGTTGSGNVVFSTSPTLVTPALGTPSAVVLTSGTGLPLTTGVTGTLPVANGGSGRVSATAYAVICGGTTSTNPEQSVATVGTAGQVLTSNGAGALPTFQNAGGTTFTSSLQTITSAGSLLIAHGLSASPNAIFIYLQNTVADLNYTVGEIIQISADAASGTNTGVAVVPNATNVFFRFGSAAQTFQYIDKTTGARNALTNANWNMFFVAKVI